MTTGISRYADISSVINPIYEGSLATLRESNLLVPTVTMFNAQGMSPRKVTTHTSANVRSVAEGEDVTPTQFSKSVLQTLTPARYADQFLLTDEMIASDWENARAMASNELGSAFAEKVDTYIGSLFSSLTGGTVGAALGTITWSNLAAARAKLHQGKVRGPYVCVLGAGQFYYLVNNGGSVDSSFTRAQAFNDRLVNNYFVSPVLSDVTIVVSANITGSGGGTAYGAMYAPQALAYDERQAFTIEPERDASRGAWELNASMRFAYGVWRAVAGVQLIGTDVIA